MRLRRLLCLVALLMLSACDALAVPTIAPTRALSAPTLAPTSNVIPRPPSEVPGSFEGGQGASNATAAGLPNNLNLPPMAVTEAGSAPGAQVVQITTDADNVLIGDLYANVPVRAPGVLLVGETRNAWGSFPQTLEANGYTVLVVSPPATINVIEFGQVISSFMDLGQGDAARLDPGRIAVLGERGGANVALRGCSPDLRCDVLGLLSPSPVENGLAPLVTAYGQRPMLVSASQTDPAVYRLSEELAATALGPITFEPLNDAGQGGAMLANQPGLPDAILGWLAQHLRE